MTDEQISKSELERQARLADVRNRRIKKIVIWLVVLVALAGAVYGIVLLSKKAEQQKPGTTYDNQGQDHIAIGAEHAAYNSNPPTSGWHYEKPADWGIYDQPLPDEELLHNLEHGGIWISYRDQNDKELIDKLKDIADDYSLKVIMTARPQNDSAIAVAAWGRLLKLDTFDRGQILDFLKAYINKGPEQVPY